jgi:DNA segregation ATPase FtsK/SpoIIIE-like protein
VDFKGVEFNAYERLPHLWQPVVYDPKEMDALVEKLNAEMERRVAEQKQDRKAEFPPLITIIDEYTEVNLAALERLVAKARAFRMYFVFATQYPDRKTISTRIRQNLVSRVAFRTRSEVESKVILGETGAERLAGNGDMLFRGNDGRVQRLQGPLVTDDELQRLQDWGQSLAEREDSKRDPDFDSE